MAVSFATLEYRKWFEVPITFDCSDHPDIVPKPGQYGLSRSVLRPNRALFDGIVSDAAVTPVGQNILPMTLWTQEKFCTKHLHFEVADFETTHNTLLGRLALTKFMAIPHYAYLVLKMSGPHGVISIRGHIKQAYNCNWESCEMTDRLTAYAEL
jgi:hypothetical protein